MTATEIKPQTQRLRDARLVVLMVLVAVILFAGAFLVTHHGGKPAPAAKVVAAKPAPKPNASELKAAFEPKFGSLAKPVAKPVVHKKPKPAARSKPKSAASTAPAPAPVYTAPAYTAPVYTAPAYTAPAYTAPAYTPPPAPTPAPKRAPPKTSTTPHGSEVVTVG
jgi:hypothetical protein